MMKKIISILFLVVSNGHANDVHYTEPKDTIDTIADKYFGQNKLKYNNRIEEYKKDLKKWNAKIKDWSHFKTGTPLYVDFPYPPFIQNSYYTTPLSMLEEKLPLRGSETYSFSYTAFAGQFSEFAAQQEIKSSQNSPLSLGATARFLFDQYNFQANINYTFFNSAEVEGNSNSSQKVTIPAEIRFHTQFEYVIPESRWSVFTGLDYEIFGTYNTLQLTQGSNIETRKNQLGYASIGVEREIPFKRTPIGLSLSYSKSFFSKSSVSSSDKFEGTKISFLSRMKINEHYQVHLLYHRYDLEGATELTINRAGFGISYYF